MLTSFLLFQAARTVGMNRIFFPVSLIFAIASIARKKESIGGWLLYFYYWIFALLAAYVSDFLLHLDVFRPSYAPDKINHEALVLAVFPRLFAILAVIVVAIMLLIKRDWAWVEKLRLVLLVEVVISGFSVWLDIRYFPNSIPLNAARLVGLFLWLIYFHVSKRVHHVFRTNDWSMFNN